MELNPLFPYERVYGRCKFGFLLFHPHNPNIPNSEAALTLLADLLEQLARGLFRGEVDSVEPG